MTTRFRLVLPFLFFCLILGQTVPSDASLAHFLDEQGFKPEALDCICRKTKTPVNLQQDVSVRSLLELIRTTQECWVRRGFSTGQNKERWEIELPEWALALEEDSDTIHALQKLGLNTERVPSPDIMENPGHLWCILGATAPSVVKRIAFLARILEKDTKNPARILLLGAERPLCEADGSTEYLKLIAASQGKGVESLTETDLMTFLWKQSPLDADKRIEVSVLNVPRKEGQKRPTTESTLEAFVAWVKEQKDPVTVISFVSNQPYLDYQEVIISHVTGLSGFKIPFKVKGPGCAFEHEALLVKGGQGKPLTVASRINALGSLLWASLPDWLLKLSPLLVPAEKEEIRDLYKGSPTILGKLAPLLGTP